jgi:hypothetical protein
VLLSESGGLDYPLAVYAGGLIPDIRIREFRDDEGYSPARIPG